MLINDLYKDTLNYKLLMHFENKVSVHFKDIRNYLKRIKPDINDNAIGVKLYKLKKKGLISNVGKGVYVFNRMQEWKPAEDKTVSKIIHLISNSYPEIDFLVWNTNVLSEFMNLLPFKNFTIIETEDIVSESVFFYLKEKKIKDLYYKPDKKEFEFYTGNQKITCIIKSLITKSPLQKDNRHYPKLEKILVDIFCDSDLFIAFQGSELNNIWINSFRKYAVNISTLNNYARRRGKLKEITEYVKKLNLFTK